MRRIWLPILGVVAVAVIGCDPPQPKSNTPPPPVEDSQIDKAKIEKPVAPRGLAPPKKGGGPPPP